MKRIVAYALCILTTIISVNAQISDDTAESQSAGVAEWELGYVSTDGVRALSAAAQYVAQSALITDAWLYPAVYGASALSGAALAYIAYCELTGTFEHGTWWSTREYQQYYEATINYGKHNEYSMYPFQNAPTELSYEDKKWKELNYNYVTDEWDLTWGYHGQPIYAEDFGGQLLVWEFPDYINTWKENGMYYHYLKRVGNPSIMRPQAFKWLTLNYTTPGEYDEYWTPGDYKTKYQAVGWVSNEAMAVKRLYPYDGYDMCYLISVSPVHMIFALANWF